MKDFSNKYIFVFSVTMVAIVAALLSTAAMLLQPRQERNREIEKKRNILASIRIEADRSNASDLYSRLIRESLVINNNGDSVDNIDPFKIDLRTEQRKPDELQNLPLFIAYPSDTTRVVIIPLEGKGLWGPIYGYISLESDLSTVYGVNFDHKGETPGLGAEINTSWFEDMFTGLKIFEGGRFVSIRVIKGGAPAGDPHAVDAISGGTITSNGLQDMLYDCLSRYEKYFNKNRL
ncbi:MAG: NADH:ubiquinone reductase (Na(+)-transporting) subunit C [Bacteroidales bacterium]|jgi:Na+-transporting NADH:ubiquinone oxidoreductase subunit C|nr:NADH:ubiquinone reductase (Na(+)-transporting) subunit C [Bacteroidales bacterium]